ncbi:hypothetical protein WJX73_009597 [Symbiochloris irregularis]|uniref:RWP-RK domain-containing protein n=1 Tax=Symbiochloris irregularis TaxID=706552 RepID=A0AAW1P872_9CHLO
MGYRSMTSPDCSEQGSGSSGLLLAHFADDVSYQEFETLANQQSGCLSCSAAHSRLGWLIGVAEFASEQSATRAREALEVVCLQSLPGQYLGPSCLDLEDSTEQKPGAVDLQQRSGSNGSSSSTGTVLHGNARVRDITFEQISQHFQYGLRDAALLLGISSSSLKRLCRQHGIKEWPCRKLRHQAFMEQHRRAASPMPTSPRKRMDFGSASSMAGSFSGGVMGPPAPVSTSGHQAFATLSASHMPPPQAHDSPGCRQLFLRLNSLSREVSVGPLNFDMLRLPSTDMAPMPLERFPSFLLSTDPMHQGLDHSQGSLPPAPSLTGSDAQLHGILSSVVGQKEAVASHQVSNWSGQYGHQTVPTTAAASTPFASSAFTPWE